MQIFLLGFVWVNVQLLKHQFYNHCAKCTCHHFSEVPSASVGSDVLFYGQLFQQFWIRNLLGMQMGFLTPVLNTSKKNIKLTDEQCIHFTAPQTDPCSRLDHPEQLHGMNACLIQFSWSFHVAKVYVASTLGKEVVCFLFNFNFYFLAHSAYIASLSIAGFGTPTECFYWM